MQLELTELERITALANEKRAAFYHENGLGNPRALRIADVRLTLEAKEEAKGPQSVQPKKEAS